MQTPLVADEALHSSLPRCSAQERFTADQAWPLATAPLQIQNSCMANAALSRATEIRVSFRVSSALGGFPLLPRLAGRAVVDFQFFSASVSAFLTGEDIQISDFFQLSCLFFHVPFGRGYQPEQALPAAPGRHPQRVSARCRCQAP